jgi:hypothetical protein
MMVEEKTLKEIMAIKDSDIPNEIIYFKPQNSPQCFIAQKPIYEDIDSKPVLRDNPQFSHETSVAIGTFYNSANSRSSSDDGAEIIRQTIGLIDKGKLCRLGIDINNFDVLKDFKELNSKLTSLGDEELKNSLGITVGKEALMESLEKMKMVATAIVGAEKGKFSNEGEYLELENDVFKTDRNKTTSLQSPDMTAAKEAALNSLQNTDMPSVKESSNGNSRSWTALTGKTKVSHSPNDNNVVKSESHSR